MVTPEEKRMIRDELIQEIQLEVLVQVREERKAQKKYEDYWKEHPTFAALKATKRFNSYFTSRRRARIAFWTEGLWRKFCALIHIKYTLSSPSPVFKLINSKTGGLSYPKEK